MANNIPTDDVVRLIIQFLRENNLQRTLTALHNESPVSLNAVESKEAFRQDILQGRWDTVLKQLASFKISPDKLIALYEQIIVEMAELGEMDTAKALLYKSEPMQLLKQRSVERYLHIDHLLSRPQFDPTAVYPSGITKQKRREDLADTLMEEITTVPSSRLLGLLGQCLKWQQHQGLLQPNSVYDLFRGVAPVQKTEEDAFVSKPYVNIKFPGKKTYAECAVFSPNGQYLATGSVDGFIELWNYMTGKLRKDLRYQAEDQLMAMDKSVLCLAFSKNSDWLASGSIDGKIAIWKVQTGVCQRRISPAHSQGVTSICFNKDGTHVLSGGYDQTVKVHGLKSGKILKEFRGHSSFVNSVLYSNDNSRILSASSDGTVKIWDAKTTTCLHTVTPQPNADATKLNTTATLTSQTVQSILPLPKNIDQVVVCNKTNTLYIMTMRGQIVKTFSHQKKSGSDFVAAATSPQGEYIYGMGEDSTLYCFRTTTGQLMGQMKLCDAEVIGMTGHPFSNVIVSYDDAGYVYFLKP
ncbi:WD40 repeat-containing protein SMU1-like protein [Radiomyces spectabilis]|uniref:WD40 repeat-containing protein SMU1-like protein n=1 Tax=Radiomyces spectabilis TaxID=64574 RepID=UPI002220E7FB|nr:WD40 repeat-containing protein SMU1-like protein [Radiomyces spectabilis]KAI8388543.1 WD40 repeat-containing protein SMU1-like protein [Radiomyces spectabilis]